MNKTRIISIGLFPALCSVPVITRETNYFHVTNPETITSMTVSIWAIGMAFAMICADGFSQVGQMYDENYRRNELAEEEALYSIRLLAWILYTAICLLSFVFSDMI